MELPPLQQQLLSQLKQNLKGQNLLNEQQLRPGAQLNANVESVTALTSQTLSPALRQQLIQLFIKQGAALPQTGELQTKALGGSESNLASGNKLTGQHTQQQLFAIQLKILGKSLLTVTDIPLTLKDKLNVTVRPDGQLQLVKIPSKSNQSINNPKIQVNSNNTAGYSNANVKTADSIKAQQLQTQQLQHSGQASANISANKSAITTSALRHYLPAQQRVSEALNTLSTFINHEKSSALKGSSPQIDKLMTKLNNVLSKSPMIEQLIKANGLKSAIQQSGSLLESKLATLSARTNQTTQTNTLNTLAKTLGNSPPNKDANELTKIHDIKADLLRLIGDLETLTKTPSAGQKKPIGSIDQLLKALFSFSADGKSASPKAPTEQIAARLAAALQPSVFSALARISTLQLQRLTQAQQEGGTSLFGGFFELPVKLGELFYPLSIHIHEKEYEEKKEQDENEETQKNKSETKKRWHVYMEFDLDELGSFACDICLEESHVKTTLWVQKTALWKASQSHLLSLKQELEKSGITVDKLTCVQGNPPEKSIQIQQSLVDIRT